MLINPFGLFGGFRREITAHICRTGENGCYVAALRFKLRCRDNNALQIHEAGKRSAVMVRKLLAFARKQTISPEVMNLNDNVASMLKMLQQLIGENIDLFWKPGQNLWLIKMDYSQLDQILANLVVNARDAIADIGQIPIETENVEFDGQYCDSYTGFVQGQFVMLTVSDTGCGMTKEVFDNLFEPFFTTKETGKGTGLGLSTVYGIVKQNSGFINVYSEPGQGTTFRIYLPRHSGEAVALGGVIFIVLDQENAHGIL